jgi:hypothetical protein
LKSLLFGGRTGADDIGLVHNVITLGASGTQSMTYCADDFALKQTPSVIWAQDLISAEEHCLRLLFFLAMKIRLFIIIEMAKSCQKAVTRKPNGSFHRRRGAEEGKVGVMR